MHEQRAGRHEAWRAVVQARLGELSRVRATMTLDAIEFFDPRDGWVWRASHRATCWCGGTPHDAVAPSAHAAVLIALASFGRVHDKRVEEIRGPGEPTTAEREERIRDRAPDAPAAVKETTSRRWRQCSRCGRCFWLADDERVPPHPTSDDPRLGRPCERPSPTREGDPA